MEILIAILLYIVSDIHAFPFRGFNCSFRAIGEPCVPMLQGPTNLRNRIKRPPNTLERIRRPDIRDSMTLRPPFFNPRGMQLISNKTETFVAPSDIPFLGRSTEDPNRILSSITLPETTTDSSLTTTAKSYNRRFTLNFLSERHPNHIHLRPSVSSLTSSPATTTALKTTSVKSTRISSTLRKTALTKKTKIAATTTSRSTRSDIRKTKTTARRKRTTTTTMKTNKAKKTTTTFPTKITRRDDRGYDDWTESDFRPSAVGIGSMGILIIVVVVIGIIILDSSTIYRDLKTLKSTLTGCFCFLFGCQQTCRRNNCVEDVRWVDRITDHTNRVVVQRVHSIISGFSDNKECSR